MPQRVPLPIRQGSLTRGHETLRCSSALHRTVLKKPGDYAIEHPKNSAIWTQSPLSTLDSDPRSHRNPCDQCAQGAKNEHGTPVEKGTLFKASFRLRNTATPCRCVRPHAWLEGTSNGANRTSLAKIYPDCLCHRLLKDIMRRIQSTSVDSHHSSETFWTCQQCKHGSKSAAPHTYRKGCRYNRSREPPRSNVESPPPVSLEQPETSLAPETVPLPPPGLEPKDPSPEVIPPPPDPEGPSVTRESTKESLTIGPNFNLG